MLLFLEYFERFFTQNYFNVLIESISACFLEFSFFTQTNNFAKAIAFAKWPIFKMLSSLEYLVFFEQFFAQNYFNVLVELISVCFLEF